MIFRLGIGSLLVILTLFQLSCTGRQSEETRLGIDQLVDTFSHLIAGKRVGLITNHTGIASNRQTNIDLIHSDDRFELTALFGPEHGVRGDVMGGIKVSDFKDPQTGVPVYSLYGKTYKPTSEMLAKVDVLVFDIQDIGIRPYTYIYTMSRSMEAAREHGLPFIVVDRPNPMGGKLVSGGVLQPEFASGIGLHPIPYIHGMTIGELARLFNEEFQINCDLTVVPMQNWRRDMLFEDTGQLWVPTSPHIPRNESCFYIASTGGFGELGTLSEGVGTPQPFEICGAPWVDADAMAETMNQLDLPGVFFRPLHFRPYYLRFVGETCGGVQIHITDFSQYDPMAVQIHLLTTLRDLFPDQDYFATQRISSFDRAFGSDQVRLDLQRGKTAEEIMAAWDEGLNRFKAIRSRYLIYD